MRVLQKQGSRVQKTEGVNGSVLRRSDSTYKRSDLSHVSPKDAPKGLLFLALIKEVVENKSGLGQFLWQKSF